ncbi:coenzyme Q-binding protein COQ10 homolog, mitochondrial-like [Arachis ipaensis]|uniref:coenzyme Q-binding protein COQ10 homolog, mitochondrial-like n=1 Tax=Arachis ipaensis TaxID=130454 RepID=UPI000A2B0F13|nr:coenzyme Q-binding protein COQ10 homolog, mitochondrial-like [Arachis ipaensis]XP_025647910.1 coenzyme Q-binding protein COQ10 homolog, mitochondrial-like [Arachis hypogaea]
MEEEKISDYNRGIIGAGGGGKKEKVVTENTLCICELICFFIIRYSVEQLFDVVAVVDFYHRIVPWCRRLEILRHYPDGSFDAELVIGFKFLVESYISHVELERPKHIKTTVSLDTLFDHLINIWKSNQGPVPETCNLYFLVDLKFQSPLHSQIASMFFKEVASKMVGSALSFDIWTRSAGP